MSVLLLRLAAPLQSWGVASRFARRETRRHPTKSGIVGLIAAAQGRRRTDPIEDLARLRFGVRIDQPGTLLRDFQTAISLDGKQRMPLSQRFYLSDAVFVAALEGPAELLAGLRDALLSPVFPLYLGRRSCPPDGQVVLGIVNDALEPALRDTSSWQAAEWFRKRQPRNLDLEICRDLTEDEIAARKPADLVRDAPVSFDPELREYGWRSVVYESVAVLNEDSTIRGHDPFAALGGA